LPLIDSDLSIDSIINIDKKTIASDQSNLHSELVSMELKPGTQTPCCDVLASTQHSPSSNDTASNDNLKPMLDSSPEIATDPRVKENTITVTSNNYFNSSKYLYKSI
jgi:hypothetical protein